MSVIPIDGFAVRLLVQAEPSLGGASGEPVYEMDGRTRFTWAPNHGGTLNKVDPFRNTTTENSSALHYAGSVEMEYGHGELMAVLLALLFDLEEKTEDSPTAGLTTYKFRPKREPRHPSCKWGLEYHEDGPYYIIHGAVVDSIRLVATARNKARLRIDWKAQTIEQIPTCRDYTHAAATVYGQFNFRTETVCGPCYDDGPTGLSCKAEEGSAVLAASDGTIILSEDDYEIELEAGGGKHTPAEGTKFRAKLNGTLIEAATEASFDWRESKTPARFGTDRKPKRFTSGPFSAVGELALYMTGDTVPNIVAANTQVAIGLLAEFEGGRKLEINWPRAKFRAGTPDGPTKSELVYRAPWTGQEDEAEGDGQSQITLVV